MANPSYRPAPGQVPTDPGVYRFRDAAGRVVYVGKAKNLRARLANYFQDAGALHPRTRQMVATAASVEWTVVSTEVEALALEYSWIKEFDPRFNVKYRDDKSYPYLAVTMGEPFPRVQVMRGAKRRGTRYFGPFSHAWAIRETVDQLLRVFPVRTCSAGVFNRSRRADRPCLLGYIEKCSAPCVGRISEEEHRGLAQDFCDFMAGDAARFLRTVESQMRQAAAELDFERAARLRDDAAALARVVERNAIVLPDGTDADVFELVGDELEAAAQVFFVRGGRVRGQRGWIVEKVEDLTDAELVERLLQSVYGQDEADVPREILVPHLPDAADQVAEWLREIRGSRVDLRVPQRGPKRELAETVRKNAAQALAAHKARRSGDLTARSEALRQIQEALELDDAPLRIECYDISTTQGTYQVASMVVFEDGLARKAEYRHFQIRGPEGRGAADDTAAMHEVITRRFARYLATGAASTGAAYSEDDSENADDAAARDGATASPSREKGGTADDAAGREGAAAPLGEGAGPGGGASTAEWDGGDGVRVAIVGEIGAGARTPARRAFAYPPNLVVVDGGPPQVAAAARALAELGIEDVALAGLAKRLEEVWLPGEAFPVILPRASEGLYLLQRVRDEAHRFAISYHRKKRSAGMTVSALDGIPGLGPARQKALLAKFGSVKRLRAATAAELAETPGIGPALAETIAQSLRPNE